MYDLSIVFLSSIRYPIRAHGTLKSVRLPKKSFSISTASSSRGFAFIEFTSRQEAENAYEMLKHTHLLGRHLVLEWAKEDEDIEGDLEALRKKVGVGFGIGRKELPGRKRKLEFDAGGGENDEVEE